MSVRTFAEAQDLLAQTLPGYEPRSHQQDFAEAVERAIEDGRHLLAEAGTGTGKSLGYLIPSILSGKRVIISTATKALQNQVWDKDLPFLQENLGVPFSAALLKGRSNYICVNKLQEADPGDVPHRNEIMDLIDSGDALVPLNPDFSGEREDLGFEIENREWMKIAAETDDCKTFHCKDNGLCFAERARQIAKESRVVVVNHALYLTDLLILEVTGGTASFLGVHDVVVMDEAHEGEEYAGSVLGSSFKEGGVRNLMGEVRNLFHQDIPEFESEANAAVREVAGALQELWDVLEPGRIRPATLVEHADEFVNFANSLMGLVELMGNSRLLDEVPSGNLKKVKGRKNRVQNHVNSMANRFAQVINADFEDLVRWVEIERERPVLKTAPVDVAPYLRQWLFGEEAFGVTAILVSATLSVNGRFDYIAGRLGIDEYDSIDVGTPFDYQSQAATYVPRHLPDPGKERAIWSSMATTEMLDLIRASEGRALLLFTSYTEMRQAYETIKDHVPFRCMMQGEAHNRVLAQDFKEDEHSVLFATRSFMTGVDFQGDTLKLVVINKLPFPVPTEPLTEARCEKIKARGGNDFMEYTVPVMTLILKQAYGRLIRHRNDTGVVAILDPRLQTAAYGRTILKSLPDAPVVEDFSLAQAKLAVAQPEAVPI